MKRCSRVILGGLGWLISGIGVVALYGYDPLAIAEDQSIEVIDLEVSYGEEAREVPLRVYLPEERTAQPMVLFSHGLGGSKRGSRFLGEHWAKRGYVAVFLQHPGSDESVWKDVPARQRRAAMARAGNIRNTMDRLRDVPAVIDALQEMGSDAASPLAARIDFERIGMSGHSYGAITTQAVSGQSQLGRTRFTDERIKAALVLSPSLHRRDPMGASFKTVTIPWMLMTGTDDIAGVGTQDIASRLAVFPALPTGDKYELVLDGGEHHAFTDTDEGGRKRSRNPNHHRVIMAVSTAFWDAHLQNEEAAENWLKGEGPRDVLDPEDRWQLK